MPVVIDYPTSATPFKLDDSFQNISLYIVVGKGTSRL